MTLVKEELGDGRVGAGMVAAEQEVEEEEEEEGDEEVEVLPKMLSM